MDTIYYETVEKAVVKDDSDNTISRKYILRQTLVCSGVWLLYFSVGLTYGSPTVFIPQLRKEANSSDDISIEMASWLSSAFNYSGVVSSVIIAILARFIGRKPTYLFTCITALIGYIFLYYSKTTTHILISEVILGPLIASPVTISIIILMEYTSPRYRGVFLTLKSATFFWGIWAANAIGTFQHWKNIEIVAFTCSMYSLLTGLLWPESPYLLAMKNRLEECGKSHRWLKGSSKISEAELETLIQSMITAQSTPGKKRNIFRKTVKMFRTKLFYKPMLLSMLVLALYHFSGKLACGMYAIDIIKRITGAETTAYTGMLILDGITVFGMYIGCGFSKILKRRTLLLISSTIGGIFLFCISLYLYLIQFELILENTIVSIMLLMGYSLSISIGPMIMATTILGELIPVKYRSSAIVLLGVYANIIMSGIVKMCPFILHYFGARGLFMFFFISESLFTIMNYKFLPETKDKTILEIQENLRSGNKCKMEKKGDERIQILKRDYK